MNLTSADFESGVSEFEKAGLTPLDSELVKPPRLAESPIQLECELIQFVHIGEGPLAANLVIGKILKMHVDARVLNDEKQIDPEKLDVVGRLGGASYARTTDRFDLARPDVK